MPPLHPLQHQVVHRLEAQVQVRHQPRFLRQDPEKLLVDGRRIERREPQARQLPH
jgi:hypothetical protein